MGTRMIATGLLAGAGTLALTVLLGFVVSVFFRSRSSGKQLQLGIPVALIGPWLLGLFIVLVFVLWRLIGKTG